MPLTKLDTTNLEKEVTDLAHAVGLLLRRSRAVSGSNELSMTESFVLARLDRDGPATTAELARAESVKPQSMGTTVAALEAAGLVVRRSHPSDGRQILIALTDKGVTLRKSTGEAKRNWLLQTIAELDDAERETLFKAGKIIRRMVEQ